MASSETDLAGLLAAVARQDKAAFERLYRATSPKLFGVVLRILHRTDLAEEILQEAYVRIWNNAARYDPAKAAPVTWMAAIARNKAIDEARRRRPMSVVADEIVEQVADPGPTPAEWAERGETRNRLEACIGELDRQHGAMVRLAYLEGMSRQALADRFGQPVGTVKTWLRRSVGLLRDCMAR